MTDICLSNKRNEINIAKDTYQALSVIELNPAYLAFLITLLWNTYVNEVNQESHIILSLASEKIRKSRDHILLT